MATECPQESVTENEDENEGQPLLRRSQTDFRQGREAQHTNRCIASMLNVFKICFCSLGLWGHQLWNYIPRVLFTLVCIFQTIYRLFIYFGYDRVILEHNGAYISPPIETNSLIFSK